MSHIIKTPDGKSYILKELSSKESSEKQIYPCELCCFHPDCSAPREINCYKEALIAGLSGFKCYFEEVTE